MINIEMHIGGEHFAATAFLPSPSAAFVALIETNYKEAAAYQGDRLPTALRVALSGLPIDAQAPSGLASKLREVVKALEFDLTLLFVSVYVTPQEVTLCAAGDIRAHLVENAEVSIRTRDHNLLEDATRRPDVARNVLALASTRVISKHSKVAPEENVWKPRGNKFSVILASSILHKFRPPSEYIPALTGHRHQFRWGETFVGVAVEA